MRVNPGSLYRLDSIEFGRLQGFSGGAISGPVFHFAGRIFDVEKVRESIENLRKFYADNGFINFTPVPDTEVLDSRNRIRLTVTLDEGQRFYFGDLQFAHPLSAEAAQAVAADWASYKGKPYDATELVEFIKQHQILPPDFQPEHNLLIRQDAKSHTVAIVIQP